ncbi:hypothetical protein [Sphingomonas sp. 10B4]|uniref:hypothetical protein n=1 Tax=Sphingomonas sp. 10B4 TaxID=3048575 RepID=UPI002AB3B0E8|nr:hypothetical protein [Sphingomonas sp. 10B4]MDY7525865.1 hypothetical protein [Sphingomonas sp. 10B4]MEB0284395.1 hypothetical protein [Sphingomonas sp. 10B4]
MRITGYWRIIFAIMGVVLAVTLFSAFTGGAYVASASLPDDPPAQAVSANPFVDALTASPAIDRYEARRTQAMQRIAVQMSQQHQCMPWTTSYESNREGVAVICRSASDAMGMVETALVVCAVFGGLAMLLGWVARGFA